MQLKHWLFPVIFGFVGSLIYGAGPLLDLTLGRDVVSSTQVEIQSVAIKREHPDYPTHIQLPSIGVSLPVRRAEVQENDWEVFDDAVSWLKTSGTFKAGNIVIYAHNTAQFFGSLSQVQIGDEIVVSNQTQTRRYRVSQAFEGSRWDTHIINDYRDRLTLYTCSGFWDAYRYFVIAEKIDEL